MPRLLWTEGLKTSDFIEATARRSASPRRTVPRTLAASLDAYRDDLSALENFCLAGWRVAFGGALDLRRAIKPTRRAKTLSSETSSPFKAL